MGILEVNHFVTKEFRSAEAIKTLRTNLMFSGSGIKVIGIASFSASEGKSTIAFQLAASLAQAGKRVLLMDADIRKSVLQNRLKVRVKMEGLSHYLSGMAKAEDLFNETDIPGLYIMFAGARVPNPAELLSNSNFKELIPALKEVFDYVIVDAAPLGQVVDCAIMAPELDGIIMVVDAMNNSYKMERRIKAQLEKANAKILGVVLNRVDFKERPGYYGKAYKYGYKYGYGYGYGEK